MKLKRYILPLLTLALTMGLPMLAHAQGINIDLGSGDGTSSGGTMSARVVQMLGLLTILSLAPGILVMMTSFTRMIMVLSFLRSAMGVQQTPPNTVLISLALFLTFFVMAPTFEKSYTNGIQPLMEETMPEMEALQAAAAPFKTFMLDHTRQKDLDLFVQVNPGKKEFKDAASLPLQVVIPAFMISELRRAFEIGFLLFLPFLIIDMVVSSILMSMGMMMLPPVMIALPFKIIFFVLIDGWYLIAGSLIQSYG